MSILPNIRAPLKRTVLEIGMSEPSPELFVEPLERFDYVRLSGLFVTPDGGTSITKMRRYVTMMRRSPFSIFTIKTLADKYHDRGTGCSKTKLTIGAILIARTQSAADNSEPFIYPGDYMPSPRSHYEEVQGAGLAGPLATVRRVYENGFDINGTPLPSDRFGAIGVLPFGTFTLPAVNQGT